MTETIRGDVLTKQEMKQRNIRVVEGTRGGIEFHAPTYDDTIAAFLIAKGFIEDKQLSAACDYLELKNAVYGFLNAKTLAGILQTGEAGFKRGHAEAAYYIAMRYLGRNTEQVLMRAVHEAADNTLAHIAVITAYQVSFRQVVDAMELAISKVREELALA